VDCRVTHIGTATTLLEIGPLRLLTDPVFDPPGGEYRFGFGTGSRKTAGPAIAASALGRIDAVLLSHDQHDDNLDASGRAVLRAAARVITTHSGARRLGGNAEGLAPFEATSVERDGVRVEVIATPARHGPPLSRPIVGEVVGFLVRWSAQRDGALYFSGDTTLFRGIHEIARRYKVGTAILNVGAAGFRITGPIRYTFNGVEAARAAKLLAARTVIPIHYDGWSHFREPRAETMRAFEAAGLSERVRWLELGRAEALDL